MRRFFVIILCLGLLCGCSESAPEISSITPRIGRMGDVITIHGAGFGKERSESYITIAGTPPTSSSYISWSDGEIQVRFPEFGEAGLVYVHMGTKKSNPAIFTNELTLPKLIEDPDAGNNPRISQIDPASGAIGSLITIRGNNFGSSREKSGVFFSWDAEYSLSDPSGQDSFIGAFEDEFCYELWSEREIRVRVPDGAISGNLEVRTSRGNSRPVYFEITGRPGTKIYKDKRSYVISYSSDIQIGQAFFPNALYIWMPQPAISSSQQNVRLVSRNREPLAENYRGTSLFQFISLLSGTVLETTLSYEVEVYGVETSMRTMTPVRLNRPSQVGTVYVLPSTFIPSDDSAIRSQAAAIIGREQLPYAKAQRIYDWLISGMDIENADHSGGVHEALEEKKTDSYGASLLFCSLARAAGVPALPVAGILINDQQIAAWHYWAEFWLDGFGWVPLDPALGGGAAPEGFTLRGDHERYYFGNLDSRRIAFSRGERFLYQMTPRGRITARDRYYSLQNLWEEAVGSLESYSSLWSNVTIVDMQVH